MYTWKEGGSTWHCWTTRSPWCFPCTPPEVSLQSIHHGIANFCCLIVTRYAFLFLVKKNCGSTIVIFFNDFFTVWFDYILNRCHSLIWAYYQVLTLKRKKSCHLLIKGILSDHFKRKFWNKTWWAWFLKSRKIYAVGSTLFF